jgi:hypothetical protein
MIKAGETILEASGRTLNRLVCRLVAARFALFHNLASANIVASQIGPELSARVKAPFGPSDHLVDRGWSKKCWPGRLGSFGCFERWGEPSRSKNSAQLALYFAAGRLISDPCMTRWPCAVHTRHFQPRPRFFTITSKI